ncbi:MAG: LegC family aminotransferase [Thermodesulfovibrionales bacterium]|nr:LegC family aminotransferase [Thermodesulfovibrionales bacterium]
MSKIPLSVPHVKGNEWKYIKDCLDTGWVSSVGSYVDRFENALKDYVGTGFAVAAVNGTASLHVALIVSGVAPGDEVIVPALTFIAPVNAVKYCNAEPVFMDSDDTLCIDPKKAAEFLSEFGEVKDDGFTYNKKTGRRIKALVPVHVFGHPSDMDGLLDVSRKYNIDVIEDATESLGSTYKGRQTGSFGKLGCFSFNGNKIITTGGGGMIVTGDEKLAKRVRHLTTQAKSDPFEYDHDEIGYNYRLTNIQAAMGVAQMEVLDEFVSIKRKNAALYSRLLSGLDEAEFLGEKEWAKGNRWFYTLKVPAGHKAPLMQRLIREGIEVRPVWKLIHTLRMYQDCLAYRIEKAVEAYETCINIPASVSLKEEEIVYVAGKIKEYFKG